MSLKASSDSFKKEESNWSWVLSRVRAYLDDAEIKERISPEQLRALENFETMEIPDYSLLPDENPYPVSFERME